MPPSSMIHQVSHSTQATSPQIRTSFHKYSMTKDRGYWSTPIWFIARYCLDAHRALVLAGAEEGDVGGATTANRASRSLRA
jgi:hypothetical protein